MVVLESTETIIRERWDQLLAEASLCDHGRVIDLIAAAYNEPHRRYHTLGHLLHVLERLDAYEPAVFHVARHRQFCEVDPFSVRLAAFFHDFVYDPTADSNEQISAGRASELLRDLGVAGDVVREVERLILLTLTHDPAETDLNGAWLSDADLAILASDPDSYDAYAEAIRDEYQHVPEDLWKIGRSSLLRELALQACSDDGLFRLPGQDRNNKHAYRNLTHEMSLLDAA
jgi:predicted metal-dependent HD superfamily phosphohydrolase